MTPNAKTFLDTMCVFQGLEARMEEFIFRTFGWVIEDPASLPPFSGISYDDYDCSFELHEAVDEWEPTEEQLTVMFKEVGFQRCWVNHQDGQESYYWWDVATQEVRT